MNEEEQVQLGEAPGFSVSVSSDILTSERHAARRLLFFSLLAQGGALLTAKTAVAPLDRLKVLRQVSGSPTPLLSDLHWFRGLKFRLQHTVIGNFSRTLLLSKLSSNSEISSHATAAVIASSLVYPLDVRYTAATTGHKIIGNFSGFSYHLAATPVYLAASLGVIHLARNFRVDEKKFPINIFIGSVAAFTGSLVTYPLDTLRRRAMIGNLSRANLFSGLSVHAVKAFPECFVLGAVYSELLKLKYF